MVENISEVFFCHEHKYLSDAKNSVKVVNSLKTCLLRAVHSIHGDNIEKIILKKCLKTVVLA